MLRDRQPSTSDTFTLRTSMNSSLATETFTSRTFVNFSCHRDALSSVFNKASTCTFKQTKVQPNVTDVSFSNFCADFPNDGVCCVTTFHHTFRWRLLDFRQVSPPPRFSSSSSSCSPRLATAPLPKQASQDLATSLARPLATALLPGQASQDLASSMGGDRLKQIICSGPSTCHSPTGCQGKGASDIVWTLRTLINAEKKNISGEPDGNRPQSEKRPS